MTSRALAEWVILAPLLTGGVCALVPRRLIAGFAVLGGLASAGLAVALAVVTLLHPEHPRLGSWIAVDAASAVLVVVIGIIGLTSLAVSPAYLAGSTASVVGPLRRERLYYVVLLVFLSTLLAVPLAGNLAEAWLLIEATTATSALLVGFSGRRRALEAGWKYLILTSLGLGVALLGIGLLAAGVPGRGMDSLTWHALGDFSGSHEQGTVAYVLILAGLAAKVGWAPVHNWLPDAHSEAPPPVSALLSAALLPAVLLVAWRVEQGLAPVLGTGHVRSVLIGFGLASLAVAVPFLWQPLAWKRLLAYSSLEHMGVVALGIGFGSPVALAGVVIHLSGHAVAKALGFYAATPLLAHDPRSSGHPPVGIGRSAPRLGAVMGIALGALAGLPPSPLFISEVLILAGGFKSGYGVVAAIGAALLALGFLGLSHALLETVAGKARHRDNPLPSGLSSVVGLGIAAVVVMLALTAVAATLPGSSVVHALMKGAS